MNNINKTFLVAAACLFAMACKKQQTVALVLDVRYFSNTVPCASHGFSEDIKNLYTPFQFAGDTKIGVLKGSIRSVDSLQKGNIIISDTATNILSNWKKKLFGSKKDFSDVMKKYDDAFSKVSTASLCVGSTGNVPAQPAAILPNPTTMKKGYTEVLVYSTIAGDSIWENFKVYHKITDIRTHLIALASSSTGPVLVVFKPQNGKLEDPHNTPPSSLEETLGELIQPGISEEIKRQKVDAMMNTYFATNFMVVMHPDDASAIPRRWEGSGEGIKYLERLTTDQSITGFKIISAYKGKTDSKITRLELVESHNQ
ncbi:hypothetical protein [Mucilaginibacter flavidus]|uniref:hypothetical protein n=1 Tax=Mucilaginibacter flavidus TaxID=2949309 RepID=UPI00209394B3|nr:hypothetical protein [Mucilaginibacter flavidus]MCO5945378.1 hypothetical protein [Mucilaginibacter flavidus]